MLLHFQNPFRHIVGMDNEVRQGLSDSFVQRCVVFAFHSLQHKRALDVADEFGKDTLKEMIEVVLPHPVVS